MKWLVYQCTNTYQLCLQTNPLYGCWIPVAVFNHVVKGVPKKKIAAAMPGYIFVPAASDFDMRYWCKKNYYPIRPLLNADQNPASVTTEDLKLMDDILRQDGSAAEQAAPEIPKVGDRVVILCAPFAGLEGEVTSLKGDNLRLQVGSRFFNISRLLVRALK